MYSDTYVPLHVINAVESLSNGCASASCTANPPPVRIGLFHSYLHIAIARKCDSLLSYLLTFPYATAHDGDGQCDEGSWWAQKKAEDVGKEDPCLLLHALHVNAQECITTILSHIDTIASSTGAVSILRSVTWRQSILKEAVRRAGGDEACAMVVYYTLLARCWWFSDRAALRIPVNMKYATLVCNTLRYRHLFTAAWTTKENPSTTIDLSLTATDICDDDCSHCDELLTLQQICCDRGMPISCAMLIQYHAAWVHNQGSNDLPNHTKEHYTNLYRTACANDLLMIAIAILKLFRTLHMTPLALNSTMMPRGTFMCLMEYIVATNTSGIPDEGGHMDTSSSSSSDTDADVGDENELLVDVEARGRYIDYHELRQLVYSDMNGSELINSVVNLPEHVSGYVSVAVAEGNREETKEGVMEGGQSIPSSCRLTSTWTMSSRRSTSGGGGEGGDMAVTRPPKRLVVITARGKSKSFFVNAT